ncbi:hypothetical protein NEOLEDRAFT_1167245 [Neolentinus lepideus HHB14362 ss-1]|uniref:Aminoglycoside phosphotransferase domain-containing protein n=1 Tax=Neolentinus lepideus HHB14362 ss-1 TaxID=1314782 RepID=A0A165UUB4_9AGAM|nr:hypothetical protein NEOLEDRAFT_1167245 [Neolentinus lepideus HHB14362 ss-1]
MPREIDKLKLHLAELRRRQPLWYYWRAYYALQELSTTANLRAWRIYIKCAQDAVTEAATMRFVAAHTIIPVPRVWCTFPWRDQYYIAISRVPGTDLKQRGWRKLTSTAQDHIVTQLSTLFSQLRAIPPPPGTIIGSSVHRLVFTHNDVAPRNIMIADDDSGRITGLIDWECAAWLPEYWEYLVGALGLEVSTKVSFSSKSWILSFSFPLPRARVARGIRGIWGLYTPTQSLLAYSSTTSRVCTDFKANARKGVKIDCEHPVAGVRN